MAEQLESGMCAVCGHDAADAAVEAKSRGGGESIVDLVVEDGGIVAVDEGSETLTKKEVGLAAED